MSLGDLTSRDAVLEAIAEFDQLGRDAFMSKYGFGTSWKFRVEHEGKRYDAKAIAGVAHGFQFPEKGPLASDEMPSGARSTKPKLESLGFTVVADDKQENTVARWESAIEVCRPLIEDRTYLDSEEIDYKLEIAKRIQELYRYARAGQPIFPALSAVFKPPNNLLHYIVKGKFQDWAVENEADAKDALLALDSSGSVAERVDGFLKHVPEEILTSEGNKLSLASLFLMGLDPGEFPIYLPEPIQKAEKLLGWDKPNKGPPFGAIYGHHRAFVGEFLARLNAAGVDAKDMLDAQSLIWHLSKSKAPAAAAWRGDQSQKSAGTIDLVLKWSAAKESKTIEYHREVADGPAGSVWWGRVTKNPESTGLSEKPLAALRDQLAAGTETYVFLNGATTWKTRLLEITTDEAEVDPALVPSYYVSTTHHSLWVKLADFEEVDAHQLIQDYVLASSGEPVTQGGLGNQSPLIVRRRALGEGSKYFLLNQSFDGTDYADVEGQSYAWTDNSSGAWKQLASSAGAKFVYYRPGTAPDETSKTYFGIGQIGEIDETVDEAGKKSFTATIEGYKAFESPVPFAEGPSRNAQTSIQPISAAQFERLVAQGMPDQELEPLSLAALKGEAESKGLKLPDVLYAQVLAALGSGKHIILTGPPGTAKTTFAQAIAETATTAGHSAGYLLTTATADWTTFETIGGLRPTKDGELEFSEGHFLAAIEARQWLIIDELNRSNFDRAFGQLFTVLSGQPVALPYSRGDGSRPVVLVPEGADVPSDESDPIKIPQAWRIVATMNVFDKSLLFEMSFALMRRFAFIEVPSPEREIFEALIEEESSGNAHTSELATKLLDLRELKDLGPAVFMDIARYMNARSSIDAGSENGQLLFEAFYSYLLPQFEGVDALEGELLFKKVSMLVGNASLKEKLRATLNAVLGLDLQAPGTGADSEPD